MGTPRIGLYARDALRIEGMRSLLGDGDSCSVTVLTAPRAVDLVGLDLVVIDGTATEHMLALVAVLLRSSPGVWLLVLGGAGEGEDWGEKVLEAGARGFLADSCSADELKRAVAVVLDGSMWAPRKVLTRLLERARRSRGGEENPHRSRRELAVLHLLLEGLSNGEIGRRLDIAEGTVKSHLARLMRKAGVRTRTELTMRAVAEGDSLVPKRE